MRSIPFLVDLVDFEFIFVSVRILKKVDLAGLEGLLNILSFLAGGFADFEEIIVFGDKKLRIGRQGRSIFPTKTSAVFGIHICLDSPLRFLPSLLFSEFSRFRRINQIHHKKTNDSEFVGQKMKAFTVLCLKWENGYSVTHQHGCSL